MSLFIEIWKLQNIGYDIVPLIVRNVKWRGKCVRTYNYGRYQEGAGDVTETGGSYELKSFMLPKINNNGDRFTITCSRFLGPKTKLCNDILGPEFTVKFDFDEVLQGFYVDNLRRRRNGEDFTHTNVPCFDNRVLRTVFKAIYVQGIFSKEGIEKVLFVLFNMLGVMLLDYMNCFDYSHHKFLRWQRCTLRCVLEMFAETGFVNIHKWMDFRVDTKIVCNPFKAKYCLINSPEGVVRNEKIRKIQKQLKEIRTAFFDREVLVQKFIFNWGRHTYDERMYYRYLSIQ